MKHLTEYQTPITDAMRSGIPHPKAAQIMLASHGDLERKLALCRDALAEIVKLGEDMPEPSEETEIAIESLDQTK